MARRFIFRPRPTASARKLLAGFRTVRDGTDHDALLADLSFMQQKDLDLSVRLGALLAFDALMITAAINPISASPGAPLSLDAVSQPFWVWIIVLGVALLAISALMCVRAIMVGEEFSTDGIEGDPDAISRRLFAAYCVSIDAQTMLLAKASRWAIVGGLVSGVACIGIMIAKML